MPLRLRLRLGFGALVGCGVYFVAEVVSASAWPSGYDWSANYISDLGVPECLGSMAELGSDRIVCSPLHQVMNAGFMLSATATLIALLALWPLLRPGWRWVVAAAALLHVVGSFVVALFPGSVAEEFGGDPSRMALHAVGAVLAIGFGNVLLVLVVLTTRGLPRPYVVLSALLAVIGVVAMVAFSADVTFGLGVGGIERAAVYSFQSWFVITGVAGLVAGSRVAERLSSPGRPAR